MEPTVDTAQRYVRIRSQEQRENVTRVTLPPRQMPPQRQRFGIAHPPLPNRTPQTLHQTGDTLGSGSVHWKRAECYRYRDSKIPVGDPSPTFNCTSNHPSTPLLNRLQHLHRNGSFNRLPSPNDSNSIAKLSSYGSRLLQGLG